MRFTVHTSGIAGLTQALAAASTRAEHAVAIQVAKDTAPFVPARTGSLTQRTRVAGGTVIYPGPYARFLYYGKVMVDPATGSTYAPKGGTKEVTPRNLTFSTSMHPQAQARWFEVSKAVNRQKWIRVADKAVKKFGKR
uniref:Minor capsid protein n=1 Tax=Myoviridae sp. ctRPH1 TaxID=2826650 RepID=A0A8S5MAJ0_9CAUD|nr:MAG TPA: Minor capsid protein [Myoviridae sp. ctRPH1]